MKAQELSVGNIIEGELEVIMIDALVGEVTLISNNSNIVSISIEKAEPTPLTEEWLERFGFEKVMKEDEFSGKTISNGRIILEHGSDGYYHDIEYWVAMKHVHQLQNLYFALTGEEI